MLEELEQMERRLRQIKETIEKTKFFEIEKLDIYKTKDPIEIEKTIEILLEIRTLSSSLVRPFAFIQHQAIERRIEAEKCLNLLNQKALQPEELVFLFQRDFYSVKQFFIIFSMIFGYFWPNSAKIFLSISILFFFNP